jgi:choline dehydrogenase-like flavoprotein
MIFNHFHPNLLKKTYDVCIVGAGPAGLSLAKKAAETNPLAQILIVEAGGMKAGRLEAFDQGTQSGDIDQFHKNYVNGTSRYGLGGNATVWSGNVHPLPHLMKNSEGFDRPISKSEYLESCDFLGARWASEWDLFLSNSKSQMDSAYETPYINVSAVPIVKRHGLFFRKSLSVTICLNLTLNAFLEDGQRIQQATGDWHNSQVIIKAESFVFACGGLNNVRCLAMIKSSSSVTKFMLNAGNRFLEHPTLSAMHFWPDVKLERKYFAGPENKSGYFFRVDGREIYIKLRTKYSDISPTFDEQINLNSLRGLRELSRAAAATRRVGVVWIRLEDLNESENKNVLRVLSPKNGLPQLSLHYDLDPFLMKSLPQIFMESSLILRRNRRAFCALNTQFNQNPKKLIHLATHPSGTTPIGISSHNSVVNSDLRHHHLRNLYIVGSSLFTKVSSFNPTLSVVALSMRLGKDLVSKYGR